MEQTIAILNQSQDWLNKSKVNEYANKLRAGEKVVPVQVYDVAGKGRYILDGHHRYAASQLTGIPVDIQVIPGGGPIGFPNWTFVIPQ